MARAGGLGKGSISWRYIANNSTPVMRYSFAVCARSSGSVGSAAAAAWCSLTPYCWWAAWSDIIVLCLNSEIVLCLNSEIVLCLNSEIVLNREIQMGFLYDLRAHIK